MVNDPDRKRALRAFEAATLYTLRRSLKNGSFSVAYSFAYRSRESMPIPLAEWEKNKGKYYKALGLSRSPETFLKKLTAQLQSVRFCTLAHRAILSLTSAESKRKPEQPWRSEPSKHRTFISRCTG